MAPRVCLIILIILLFRNKAKAIRRINSKNLTVGFLIHSIKNWLHGILLRRRIKKNYLSFIKLKRSHIVKTFSFWGTKQICSGSHRQRNLKERCDKLPEDWYWVSFSQNWLRQVHPVKTGFKFQSYNFSGFLFIGVIYNL